MRFSHPDLAGPLTWTMPGETAAECVAKIREFEADRIEAAQHTIWATGCRSWYLDDRGVPAAWPWGFDRFRRAMSRPTLADYQLVR